MDTTTLEAYPLIHVDEAATTAIDNAAKVLVDCLVDVVVARRRAIAVKGTQRAELVAILTRSITNTAALAKIGLCLLSLTTFVCVFRVDFPLCVPLTLFYHTF